MIIDKVFMRWKCTCTYDGTDFCGWQSQANGLGVQDTLEAQLQLIFKRFIRIHGSSRTDAGVHARGQVFHFDADWLHGAECLQKAINSRLNRTLYVTKVEPVSEHFHARFSVQYKRYSYYFQSYRASPFQYRYVWDLPGKTFDIKAMHAAAQHFVGTHDFSAFAGKILLGENVYKTIVQVSIHELLPQCYSFEVIGTGFLYRMVRMMMGALMMLADNKIDEASIQKYLTLKSPERPILMAPARGLCLENVTYT